MQILLTLALYITIIACSAGLAYMMLRYLHSGPDNAPNKELLEWKIKHEELHNELAIRVQNIHESLGAHRDMRHPKNDRILNEESVRELLEWKAAQEANIKQLDTQVSELQMWHLSVDSDRAAIATYISKVNEATLELSKFVLEVKDWVTTHEGEHEKLAKLEEFVEGIEETKRVAVAKRRLNAAKKAEEEASRAELLKDHIKHGGPLTYELIQAAVEDLANFKTKSTKEEDSGPTNQG